MNVIILGAGEVGINLCTALTERGDNVTVIDSDKECLVRLEEICDVQTLEGNAADLNVLTRAGIKESDLLLAVTNNDEVNMLSCLLSKHLGPVTTVCRLKKDFYFHGTKTFYRNKFGIDLIVSPEILAALEIVHRIEVVEAGVVDSLADGNIEVVRIKVGAKFKYKNYQISELTLPSNILVGAIIRNHGVIIPGGDQIILEGDELYLVGDPVTVENMEKLLGIKKDSWFFSEKKTAFVLGGGRIGTIVAEMLALRKVGVKLIEEDHQRSQELAEELKGDILVLCEDGTDYQLLQDEGVDTTDYFVATCNDETNLLASLLAKDMGVKNVVTVVNGQGYSKVLNRLGLKDVVNPRAIAAETILQFIENRNMLIHFLTRDGRAEIIEIYTNDNFPLKDKPLKEIKFPENTLVTSVLRGEEVFIPKGEDVLLAGDVVVVFTLKSNTEAIRKMFLK